MKVLLLFLITISASANALCQVHPVQDTSKLDLLDSLTAKIGKIVAGVSKSNGKIVEISLYNSFDTTVYKGKSVDSLLNIAQRNEGKQLDSLYQIVYTREYKRIQMLHSNWKKDTTKQYDYVFELDTLSSYLGMKVHFCSSTGDKITTLEIENGDKFTTYTGKSLDSLMLSAKKRKGGDIEKVLRDYSEKFWELYDLKQKRERQVSSATKPKSLKQ